MTGVPTGPTPQLECEPEFQEQRLPDGTLRVTIVSDRGRGLRMADMVVMCSVLAASLLALVWLKTGWTRPRIYALAFGPLGVMLAGVGLYIELMTPRKQTHTVEVTSEELIIRTSMAGDPVAWRYARDDVLAVTSTGMALEVQTARGSYPCLGAIKRHHLDAVADLVHRELSRPT